MIKRFLGVICFLYLGIMSYVYFSGNLGNYLGPQLQKYIFIAMPLLLFMGLVMLFNNKVNYKFKFNDLILLLPLVMVILSGDGELTSSFAKNRMSYYAKTTIEEKENEFFDDEEENEIIDEVIEENGNENIVEDNIYSEYDFTVVDYEVEDASYSTLVSYLTWSNISASKAGKTIRFTGFALTESDYIPDGYFSIGKFEISCCAADASFNGFIVKDSSFEIVDDGWYTVEGVLETYDYTTSYGEEITILVVNPVNIKSAEKEEKYVYPCYAYDDGTCSILNKYDMD